MKDEIRQSVIFRLSWVILETEFACCGERSPLAYRHHATKCGCFPRKRKLSDAKSRDQFRFPGKQPHPTAWRREAGRPRSAESPFRGERIPFLRKPSFRDIVEPQKKLSWEREDRKVLIYVKNFFPITHEPLLDFQNIISIQSSGWKQHPLWEFKKPIVDR